MRIIAEVFILKLEKYLSVLSFIESMSLPINFICEKKKKILDKFCLKNVTIFLKIANSSILFLTCVTAFIPRLIYVYCIYLSPYAIHLNNIVPIIDSPYAVTYIFFHNIRSG